MQILSKLYLTLVGLILACKMMCSNVIADEPRVVSVGPSLSKQLTEGTITTTPTLIRELARQALLIAAHEEQHLPIRDAWLGSEMLREEDNLPFEVQLTYEKTAQLEVFRGLGKARQSLVRIPLVLGKKSKYEGIVEQVEVASRTSLVELLEKEDFHRTSAAPVTDKKTDAPASDRAKLAANVNPKAVLDEFDVVTLFDALRHWHRDIDIDGDNAERLGQLVRGYALLGVLTEHCWHPAHKVFKARSLIYAQRMVVREPKSSTARFHRAYAFALAGLHNVAMADCQAAATLLAEAKQEEAATEIEAPAWVPVILAYSKMDLNTLDQSAANDTIKPLAMLLKFFALEQGRSDKLTIDHGLQLLANWPACYRVQDGVCRVTGVGLGHSITYAGPKALSESFVKGVRSFDDSPPELAATLQDQGVLGRPFGGNTSDEFNWKQEARAIAALLALGKPAKPDDATNATISANMNHLRWETLGLLMREIAWTQIWRRAYFEHTMLGVPTDDWLNLSEPIVKLHPYAPFMEQFSWNEERRRKALQTVAELRPVGMELQAGALATCLRGVHPLNYNTWILFAICNSDDTASDLIQQTAWVQKGKANFVRRLSYTSPASPQLAIEALKNGATYSAEKLAEWESVGQMFPQVAESLGVYYKAQHDLKSAKRCLETAVDKSHEYSAYQALAELYLSQKKEDEWLITLEKFLEQPAYGLEHAQVRIQIANRLMDRWEFAKARPYTEAAAESYSAWGLLAAARCHEALRDWKQAEAYHSACSQRYRTEAAGWYTFCKRTGQGNVTKAREVMLGWLQEVEELPNTSADLLAMLYILERLPEDALKHYQRAANETNDPFSLLMVAFLHDELKQPEQWQAALNDAFNKGPAYVDQRIKKPRLELVELAQIFKTDMEQGGQATFELADVEAKCADLEPLQKCTFRYFLGRYLDRCGKKEAAIEQWKQCMAFEPLNVGTRTLAGDRLITYNIKPEDYENIFATPKPNPDK